MQAPTGSPNPNPQSMAWKSVSVVTHAKPERVWEVYSAFRWQEWDHDIESMNAVQEGGLVDGSQVRITMKKDRKTHVATFSEVSRNQCFTYTAPLLGSSLVAVHRLEALQEGELVTGTRITHSFDFTGYLAGGLFRWLTADYVQHGLEANTAMLKQLAESDV
jgi:hypothetical protein